MDIKSSHSMAELKGSFNDNEKIKNRMMESLKKNNIPILKYTDFKFEPQGYTISILLAASHFYIHTFPEKDFAYCDCFTCGDFDSQKVIEDFCSLMNLKILSIKTMNRP